MQERIAKKLGIVLCQDFAEQTIPDALEDVKTAEGVIVQRYVTDMSLLLVISRIDHRMYVILAKTENCVLKTSTSIQHHLLMRL